MNIQLLSDLHLEVQPDLTFQPAPGADLLVLAGDIGSYQYGSRLAGPDFGLDRFSPLRGWPVPVLYVPGNHEYDALDLEPNRERLRTTCERLGITWLDEQVIVRDGVRFIGSTLWSDFDALALDAPASKQLKIRDKCMRAANFYLRKTGSTWRDAPFLADAVRECALASQAWLRQALAVPHAGPTVVVTHFAPSLGSMDPRYGRVPGTAGFCNALDDLLPLATVWMHGHLHCPSRYQVGGCRVVANPLGYAGKGEQAGFDPRFCVRV